MNDSLWDSKPFQDKIPGDVEPIEQLLYPGYSAMPQTIPVLSLNDFLSSDPNQRRAFIRALGQALEQVGFFALCDHSIDRPLIQAAYGDAEAVFSLPADVKAQYEVVELKGQRGFTAFGREHAKDSICADLKEFWHIGNDTIVPHNIWPQEVPTFQTTMEALFQQLDHCASLLLEACALYLDLPQYHFQAMTADSATLLRVLHYPPVPTDIQIGSMRAAPHEDINLITLLCEATAPGLELKQADDTWLPIAAIPGQIIVDTGDMLQNLTNGLFRSTTHRVTNSENSRDRRFSLPFFVHPRPETDLSPLPTCIARTGGAALFPNITAGEYLIQRLQEIGLA